MRFQEVQYLPQRRAAVMLALPPCGMTALLVWHVALGHPWGKQQLSDASVIGWTIVLWLIYARLLTVRLVTEIRDGEMLFALRGFWRARRIPISTITSVDVVHFDPVRDYGGYGIRVTKKGKAYIAGGEEGIRLMLKDGSEVVVGSRRAEELAAALRTVD
jgi:hypothetical protein